MKKQPNTKTTKSKTPKSKTPARKSPIDYISITRAIDAYPHGITTETTVYFSRKGQPSGRLFNTVWALRGTHPISPASVIRAKRAQLWLVEKAQAEHEPMA